jgi:hypothetical protein
VKLCERFWAKVDKNGPNGCWVWTAAKCYGYGAFNLGDGRVARAHRYSYELLVGPIPAGAPLDHLCRNKACVNPEHLEIVTLKENTRRAMRIGYNHPGAPATCKHGHDWSANPPYEWTRPDGLISRRCRVCHADRARSYRKAGAK